MNAVFDLDGTLFETAVSLGAAVERVAGELGESLPERTVWSGLIGLRTREFLAALFPKRTVDGALCGRFRALEREETARHGVLYGGAEELLRARQGEP